MQPFYLSGEVGQRFCLYHPARGRELGGVIYLHPFAEEMNKSRRMAAVQARALAAAGYGVLQIDLLGCGDSSGDFSDATWSDWQADVRLACRWWRERSAAPLTLWGLRAGCLLAAAAAPHLPEAVNFIFWQPVMSGKSHWQQFMRLKLAGELAGGDARAIAGQLRQRLADGLTVEIAGYTVASALASGLESAELIPPTISAARNSSDTPCAGSRKVAWLELSTRPDGELSLAAQRGVAQWQAAGCAVTARLVRGPGFWQTSEIEEAPELVSATLAILESFH